ncbi:MAG: tetratricopeptide repeat protein [Candidatus Thermoplasmatota archaeon]
MKFCHECGAKLKGLQKFCSECGTKFILEDITYKSKVVGTGDVEGIISKSEVTTTSGTIKDSVISHSTITQVSQHFGETVGTFETQMELGRTSLDAKNYKEAIESFNSALKIQPNSYEPWLLKGVACGLDTKYDEAIMYIEKAKTVAPNPTLLFQPIKYLLKGVASVVMEIEANARELTAKADTERKMAIEAKARHEEAKRSGDVATMVGLLVAPAAGMVMGTQSAAKRLEEKSDIEKYEENANKLENEAKKFFEETKKGYDFMLKLCNIILEFEENDEFVWIYKGNIYFTLRNFADASKCYEKVLNINPNNNDVRRNLGFARQQIEAQTLYRCNFCAQVLIYVPAYRSWYCQYCMRYIQY